MIRGNQLNLRGMKEIDDHFEKKTTNKTSEGKRVEKVDGKDKDNEAAAHSQQGPRHSIISRVDLPEWDLLNLMLYYHNILAICHTWICHNETCFCWRQKIVVDCTVIRIFCKNFTNRSAKFSCTLYISILMF